MWVCHTSAVSSSDSGRVSLCTLQKVKWRRREEADHWLERLGWFSCYSVGERSMRGILELLVFPQAHVFADFHRCILIDEWNGWDVTFGVKLHNCFFDVLLLAVIRANMFFHYILSTPSYLLHLCNSLFQIITLESLTQTTLTCVWCCSRSFTGPLMQAMPHRKYLCNPLTTFHPHWELNRDTQTHRGHVPMPRPRTFAFTQVTRVFHHICVTSLSTCTQTWFTSVW